MADSNYWTRRRVGRRSLIRGMVLGGMGLAGAALIGCGGSDESTDGSAGTPATGGGAAAGAPTPVTATGLPKRGGTVTIVAASDASHLDPATTFVTTSAAVWGLVYNRLVTSAYGGDAAPNTINAQPDLAESWEISDDGLEYIFHLRPGVKFQNLAPLNGRELTAEDVKYSFERSATIENAANSNLWSGVESFEAVDDKTFRMTRSAPNADFFNQMASQYAVVYPRELEASLETQAIGTGPFVLENWERDRGFSLRRNPDFYLKGEDGEALPYLDGFEIAIIPDAAARQAALRSGTLTLDSGLAPDDIEGIRRTNPELVVRANPPGYETNQHFSVNVSRKPYDDPRVRRGLSMGIDRDKLGIAYYGSETEYVKAGLIPYPFLKSEPWTAAELGVYHSQDLAEAQKLLSAAGVLPLDFDLLFTTNYEWTTDYAQVAAQDWATIGVNAKLVPMDYTAFWNIYRTSGEFDAVMSMMGSGPVVDHYAYGFTHSKASRNYPRINDPKVDELAIKQRSILDETARQAVIRELFDHVQDQAYYAWFLGAAHTYVVQDARVRNFTGKTLGTHLYLTYEHTATWLDA